MREFDDKLQADKVYNSIVTAKWYKKYTRLVEKDIDVTNYHVVEKRVNDILSLVDLEVCLIDYGTNRLAVRHGDLVVKLLIYWNSGIIRERDLLCNLENRGLTKLSSHLCPMYINNDYISVHPFCTTYTAPVEVNTIIDGTTTLLGKEVDNILVEFANRNILLEDVSKESQWGILNGKVVLLDYEDYTILN